GCDGLPHGSAPGVLGVSFQAMNTHAMRCRVAGYRFCTRALFPPGVGASLSLRRAEALLASAATGHQQTFKTLPVNVFHATTRPGPPPWRAQFPPDPSRCGKLVDGAISEIVSVAFTSV